MLNQKQQANLFAKMQFKTLKCLNGINTIKPLLRLTFLVAFLFLDYLQVFLLGLNGFIYIIFEKKEESKKYKQQL